MEQLFIKKYDYGDGYLIHGISPYDTVIGDNAFAFVLGYNSISKYIDYMTKNFNCKFTVNVDRREKYHYDTYILYENYEEAEKAHNLIYAAFLARKLNENF